MEKKNHEMTLDAVRGCSEVVVKEIQGGWGIRQRLGRMGLHPGDRIFVKRTASMGGPVLIQAHGTDIALGRGMAGRVVVEST